MLCRFISILYLHKLNQWLSQKQPCIVLVDECVIIVISICVGSPRNNIMGTNQLRYWLLVEQLSHRWRALFLCDHIDIVLFNYTCYIRFLTKPYRFEPNTSFPRLIGRCSARTMMFPVDKRVCILWNGFEMFLMLSWSYNVGGSNQVLYYSFDHADRIPSSWWHSSCT